MSFFSLSINEAELQEQVDKYDTLKPHQSYRGISAIAVSALILLGLIISYAFGDIEGFAFEDFLYGFIIFLPFLIFTYLGHQWAIAGLGLLFIFDRVVTLMIAPSIMPIIWMVIILPYIWKAWKVESIRKSKLNPATAQLQSLEKAIYCSQCGEINNPDAKFCRKCGGGIK